MPPPEMPPCPAGCPYCRDPFFGHPYPHTDKQRLWLGVSTPKLDRKRDEPSPISDPGRAVSIDDMVQTSQDERHKRSLERIETVGTAPRGELMLQALAHYQEISSKVGWWNSVVPEALRAWGAQPTALELLADLIHCLPERYAVGALYDIAKRRQRLLQAYDAAWKAVEEERRAAQQAQG